MKVLIVGAGLYGAVCAQELSRAGHRCTVIEQREHVGGNVHTRWVPEAGCHEHVHGAHIFHTASRPVWDYVQRFARFNRYVHRVKARHGDALYSFPVNLMTLHQVFGVRTPEEARAMLRRERADIAHPANMEQYCLATIGPSLYTRFIEHYTTRQWGRHPRELPPDAVRRLPVRLTFGDRYFDDPYEGIPEGGYTAMVEAMLEGSEVRLATDCLTAGTRDAWIARHDLVIFTGPIDAFFGHALGALAYRSLRFERQLYDVPDWQGCAVVNWTDAATPWTRTIEHRHFDDVVQARAQPAPALAPAGMNASRTLVTYEYPQAWERGRPAYYPVNDAANNALYQRYRQMAAAFAGKVHFGGRLGQYRYLDMHQVIAAALKFCRSVTV